MSFARIGNLLLKHSLNKFQHGILYFSTTPLLSYNKKSFRKRWIMTDSWDKVKSRNAEINWLSCLPRRLNPDKWTQDEACFGSYDFVKILGNDVTLSNELFCRGPNYVRAYKANELCRLIVKKKQLGKRIHLEHLDSMEKRMRYLSKVENFRKAKTNGYHQNFFNDY